MACVLDPCVKLNFMEVADSIPAIKRQLEQQVTQESSARESSSRSLSQESSARGECVEERTSGSSPEASKGLPLYSQNHNNEKTAGDGTISRHGEINSSARSFYINIRAHHSCG